MLLSRGEEGIMFLLRVMLGGVALMVRGEGHLVGGREVLRPCLLWAPRLIRIWPGTT